MSLGEKMCVCQACYKYQERKSCIESGCGWYDNNKDNSRSGCYKQTEDNRWKEEYEKYVNDPYYEANVQEKANLKVFIVDMFDLFLDADREVLAEIQDKIKADEQNIVTWFVQLYYMFKEESFCDRRDHVSLLLSVIKSTDTRLVKMKLLGRINKRPSILLQKKSNPIGALIRFFTILNTLIPVSGKMDPCTMSLPTNETGDVVTHCLAEDFKNNTGNSAELVVESCVYMLESSGTEAYSKDWEIKGNDGVTNARHSETKISDVVMANEWLKSLPIQLSTNILSVSDKKVIKLLLYSTHDVLIGQKELGASMLELILYSLYWFIFFSLLEMLGISTLAYDNDQLFVASSAMEFLEVLKLLRAKTQRINEEDVTYCDWKVGENRNIYRCEDCDGKYDPISMEKIPPLMGVCAKGVCLNASTIQGENPYTREQVTREEGDMLKETMTRAFKGEITMSLYNRQEGRKTILRSDTLPDRFLKIIRILACDKKITNKFWTIFLLFYMYYFTSHSNFFSQNTTIIYSFFWMSLTEGVQQLIRHYGLKMSPKKQLDIVIKKWITKFTESEIIRERAFLIISNNFSDEERVSLANNIDHVIHSYGEFLNFQTEVEDGEWCLDEMSDADRREYLADHPV